MMQRSVLLLSAPVLCMGHGAHIWPPNYQDAQGSWVAQPGTGWMGSGVTGFDNEPCTIPAGIAEVFDEDSPYRTWCTTKNRQWKGQCAYYTRKPWLAPGTAHVYSPCGISASGGVDARSLPGNTEPAQWQAGSVVEVMWAIYANHGGGYQYRLCPMPASGNRMDATEACFQQTPLRFASENVQLQNAMNNTHAPRVSAKALRAGNGTIPAGYQWAVNPIPNADPNGFPFDPLTPGACGFKGDEVTTACPYPIANWRIIDQLQVPSGLRPGKYILSFRWDTEQQVQVWSSCSDILVTKAEAHA